VNAPVQKKSEGTAYPLFALDPVLKVAEAIQELGGVNGDVRRELLAAHLQLAQTSPSFHQRIGAAKAYGMIEGKGAYRLSESAKRYFLPTGESDKEQALLDLFASPQLYSQLIKRFDGQKLPSKESLANLLQVEFKIGASWTERIAGFFIRSAQYAGALDGQGYLRYTAARHRRPAVAVNPKTPQFTSAHPPIVHSSPELSAETIFRDPGSGASVRVEITGELPSELWEKLNGYIQILKPQVKP
jgi:hypothetical protein